MPWVRLEDLFPEHPKVQRAGQAAAWLHVAGICYSSRHLTDGMIPEAALAGLGQYNRGRARRLADTLVEAGLWERVNGGYLVHDYLDFQPSRESIEQRREVKRRAGRAGGLAKGKQGG